MKYIVISGEYKQIIHSNTPKQAAINAIELWQNKKKKPVLATITTVANSKNEEVYLLTTSLTT